MKAHCILIFLLVGCAPKYHQENYAIPLKINFEMTETKVSPINYYSYWINAEENYNVTYYENKIIITKKLELVSACLKAKASCYLEDNKIFIDLYDPCDYMGLRYREITYTITFFSKGTYLVEIPKIPNEKVYFEKRITIE